MRRLAALACLLAAACGSGAAVQELRRGVLFYSWTHGSSLPPEQVSEMTRERVRALREIEDFAGTLEEWSARTSPVQRIRVGRGDYAVGSNIFFYYLASLREPAVAKNLEVRITRTGPDGSEVTDLITQAVAQVNRQAQSAGMLYSMAGLEPGVHRLHLEVLDGNEVAASGDLWVEYDPGIGAGDPSAGS